MIQSRTDFTAFLRETLAPDLRDSGTDATAATCDAAACFLEDSALTHVRIGEDTAFPAPVPFAMHNAMGKMTVAPKDLKDNVVLMYGGMIVWSRTKIKDQVRYGLQVKTFEGKTRHNQASEELGYCIQHYATCESLLDDD